METMPTLLGPIQILTVILNEPQFDGRIADQIAALEDAGIVTLIDAALVVRDSEDDFTTIDMDASLFGDRQILGSIAGALLGLGAAGEEGAMLGAEIGADAPLEMVDSEDLLDLADMLPIGSAAAVVVFEQTWARGLMGAIRDSGGEVISDGIIHAEDLIDMGFELDLASEE